ncbi:MAG: pyruvate, water dikinase [Deltaproteobacteria bacterium]|nr:pyruvate, water dikinase [Deltaproteobacteria bacterium]MBW2071343.1 pyruvate, water dikinase [Deltaproteobacteria bacterium]
MGVLERLKKTIFPGRQRSGEVTFLELFKTFQNILEKNNKILEVIAGMGDKLGGEYVFDKQYIISSCREVGELVRDLIYDLNIIAQKKYLDLYDAFERIHHDIEEELAGRPVISEGSYVIPLEEIPRDSSDMVGGKMANLGEIVNILGLASSPGFVITTAAFKAFMEYNNIWDRIREQPLDEKSAEEIYRLICDGSVPGEIQNDLQSCVDRLADKVGRYNLFFAVRSSARGEDSLHSFAGQFKSYLNEPVQNLTQCYKEVVASGYSPSALAYRREKEIGEDEVAMAVGCQLMVQAEASGVLYTMDPTAPAREIAVIEAIWGLGAPLVSGEAAGDHYLVSRIPPHEVEAFNVRLKTSMLIPKEGGGTETVPVPEELRTCPCIAAEHIRRLVELALVIERYFKKPQDIEWALDRDGQFVILQSRPLNIQAQVASLVCDLSTVGEGHRIIFRDKGSIAQRGIGAGTVWFIRSDEDMENFPAGAILVSKRTSPRLARVVPKASGILTDVGSPTGHMATIAREFRVPTIVNTGVATSLLEPGQEITVDAEQNVVYEGRVKELCYYEFTEEPFEESDEYRLLLRVLKKIAPLNLVNPHERNFAPEGCKTYHDITRFVHEKAVAHLIHREYHGKEPDAPARRLKLNIPIGLLLIDIGGGIDAAAGSGDLQPEQVTSVPLRAILEGMTHPGMWSTEPMSVDLGSFMSSLTRTFSSQLATPKYLGQNLAVVSQQYMNLSLRLGYHFNMVDAYISENINDNYAYFRFLGGVTELLRRERRVRLLAEILEQNDFRVDVTGDLVVGRIKKLDVSGMIEKMKVLGHLVAFTRQLDVQMIDDDKVNGAIAMFNKLAAGNLLPESKGRSNGQR